MSIYTKDQDGMTDVERRLTGNLANYCTDDLRVLIGRAQEELAKSQGRALLAAQRRYVLDRRIFTIELRAIPMDEHEYEATDVACEVRVNGRLVGYGNDYGTFEDLGFVSLTPQHKDAIEEMLEHASEVWTV